LKKNLKDAITSLPDAPGVYMYRNSSGNIIYIGKAKDLKKRVASYFSGTKDLKTTFLVKNIDSLEVIITSSEYEALILENNLIKKHRPKYNINLKDGKTYPVIRLTNEDFPRIFKTRRIINDGSEYFGPYTDVGTADGVLDLIRSLFPIRRCRNMKGRKSPCLYYHMKLCAAPCVGYISEGDYSEYIVQIRELLNGGEDELKRLLEEKMQQSSAALRFEEAAKYRDLIVSVSSLFIRNSVESSSVVMTDYISFAREGMQITYAVFQMREGKLAGRDIVRVDTASSDSDAFSQFLMQYYPQYHLPPEKIVVPVDVSAKLPEQYLNDISSYKISLEAAMSKKDLAVLNMAGENAVFDLNKRVRKSSMSEILKKIRRELGLRNLPKHIEGFDIAQLHGKYPVASLICFREGLPSRSEYRYFRLKSTENIIDDYQSMREAVGRRYRRLLNENKGLPDLLIVDGGPGQVSAAVEMLNLLDIDYPDVIGLAKKEETVYFSDGRKPVVPVQGSEVLRVLQAVRDETHRFATGLNKKLRKKDLKFSLLESIPGVGEKTSRLVMENAGSITELKKMSPQQLNSLTGVNLKLCEKILEVVRSTDSAL
jgi:excinuclease ABC subunit C